MLAGQDDGYIAPVLVGGVIQLGPTRKDRRQARDALLRLLAGPAGIDKAEALVGGVVQLAAAGEDRRQARDALLGLLIGQAHRQAAKELAAGIVQLEPTAQDRRQARDALLGLLADDAYFAGPWEVDRVVQLAPTAEEKRQARDSLLGLLTGQVGRNIPHVLVSGVIHLDPTSEDKRRVRGHLLGLLTGQSRGFLAAQTDEWVMRVVLQLDPAVRDPNIWRACAIRSSDELLAMLRRNSALADWLSALPWLSKPQPVRPRPWPSVRPRLWP